jgi:uncharacterized protein (TIGR02001 family)
MNMNSFIKTLTAAALATVSGIAAAADAGDISANVSMATDYIWRGVSQTNQKPTIQGGFDYSHDINDSLSWYLGTWGSNVDPRFFGGVHSPTMELDTYTGLSGKAGDFTYTGGWLRYNYPGGKCSGGACDGSSVSTTEWKIGGGWKWFGVNYYVSKDWFGTSDDSERVEGTFDYDLPYDISFTSSVGNNYGTGTEDFFTDSYVDWKLGLSKKWLGVDWGVAYTDTDISKKHCGDTDLCDAHYVASLSKSF